MTNVSSESKELQMSPKGSFVANTIAYLFHPVFVPTYLAVLLYFLLPSVFQALEWRILGSWLGNIVLNTLFFPLLAMLLLKALGFIKSFKLDTRNERIIPLIASMIFYFWAWQVFRNINSPLILKALIFGHFLGIIGMFIANIFFKISMHAAGMGAALAFVGIVLLTNPFTAQLLIAFLLVALLGFGVCRSRYKIDAHRPFELYLGYAVGMLSIIVAYLILAS